MSTAAGVERVATCWDATLASKVFAKDASTEILVDEKYPKLKIDQSGAALFAIKASLATFTRKLKKLWLLAETAILGF